jgi:hypothetical protein
VADWHGDGRGGKAGFFGKDFEGFLGVEEGVEKDSGVVVELDTDASASVTFRRRVITLFAYGV